MCVELEIILETTFSLFVYFILDYDQYLMLLSASELKKYILHNCK